MLLAFFSEHLRMGWLLSDLDKSGVAGSVKDMTMFIRSGCGVSREDVEMCVEGGRSGRVFI